MYTSGSTGTPKGVMASHANVLAMFAAAKQRLGFSAERASQLEQRALKKLAESPELAALREAA